MASMSLLSLGFHVGWPARGRILKDGRGAQSWGLVRWLVAAGLTWISPPRLLPVQAPCSQASPTRSGDHSFLHRVQSRGGGGAQLPLALQCISLPTPHINVNSPIIKLFSNHYIRACHLLPGRILADVAPDLLNDYRIYYFYYWTNKYISYLLEK